MISQMNAFSISARRFVLSSWCYRSKSVQHLSAPLQLLAQNNSSGSMAFHSQSKGLANHLRGVLDKLGMTESQWKIRESEHSASEELNSNHSTSSTLNNRRIRRRRSSNNGNLIPSNNHLHPHDVKLNDPYFYANPRTISAENEVTARLKVNSVYVANSIDLSSTLTKVFNPSSKSPAINYTFGKTKLVVELPPIMNVSNDSNMGNTRQQVHPRYVAIFRYGSIVFFNISTEEVSSLTESIMKNSTDPVSKGYEKREYFEVAICPNMLSTAHVNADFATVKELDSDCVAVISTIMGQTVAFDSYNDTVDELLAKFADTNSTVKNTGNFTSMERETLFKLVAKNNSLFIDMISKLGIKDRSKVAWNLSQYERVYEEMKNEFEIESRFKDIEFKLNLIQQNTKFFLQVLDSNKSNTLEWIIIVLITFECGLMLMEMSGIGSSLFNGDLFFDNFSSGSTPTGIEEASNAPKS